MDKSALLEYGKSALASVNTDPIYLLRTFYVTAAATTAIFDLFPALQSRFINYGARGTKVKDADGKPVDDVPKTSSTSIVKLLDLLAGFQVPHSWFIQFYVVSVLSSLFWGFQIFTKGSVFEAVAKHHYENTTHQEGFMSYAQVVLTWLLMTIQGSRRLYECITLTKPSTSKMAGPAWILGILFYVAMSISVWIEGIGKPLPNSVFIAGVL
jgi:3-oxo-5-alpha-steroid 4-dehydrogenase 3